MKISFEQMIDMRMEVAKQIACNFKFSDILIRDSIKDSIEANFGFFAIQNQGVQALLLENSAIDGKVIFFVHRQDIPPKIENFNPDRAKSYLLLDWNFSRPEIGLHSFGGEQAGILTFDKKYTRDNKGQITYREYTERKIMNDWDIYSTFSRGVKGLYWMKMLLRTWNRESEKRRKCLG